MRQIRKISNLVAEELQESLKVNGVEIDESTFEEKVSSIVDIISEAVDTESEEDLLEGVEVSELYMATQDSTLGDITVKAGEYVEIDEIDLENDTITITTYDEDGEVTNEAVDVPIEDIEKFEESAEEVEFEEDEADEGFVIRGGKKTKVSAATQKLRKKLAAKKGNGVNKFRIKDGKIVKKSAAELKADKKKSKTFARRMKKFAKKRAKSLKKSLKLNGKKGKVNAGFDINADSMKVPVEEGDEIIYSGNAIDIVREGSVILSGLAVSENFFDRCVAEGVLEEKDCGGKEEKEDEGGNKGKKGKNEGCGSNSDEEDDSVDEAAVLSFQSNKGFVLVKEGSEIPMGNRVRARALLRNEGYNVTSDMLDSASAGKLVIL